MFGVSDVPDVFGVFDVLMNYGDGVWIDRWIDRSTLAIPLLPD